MLAWSCMLALGPRVTACKSRCAAAPLRTLHTQFGASPVYVPHAALGAPKCRHHYSPLSAARRRRHAPREDYTTAIAVQCQAISCARYKHACMYHRATRPQLLACGTHTNSRTRRRKPLRSPPRGASTLADGFSNPAVFFSASREQPCCLHHVSCLMIPEGAVFYCPLLSLWPGSPALFTEAATHDTPSAPASLGIPSPFLAFPLGVSSLVLGFRSRDSSAIDKISLENDICTSFAFAWGSCSALGETLLAIVLFIFRYSPRTLL